MIIKLIGQSCLKINSKNPHGEDNLIVMEPCSLPKEPKKNLLNSARIITFSQDCPLSKKLSNERHKKAGEQQSFIIKNPGEYEINNVFIFGLPYWPENKNASKEDQAKEKKEEKENKSQHNVIYLLKAEGITLTHLGNFNRQELLPAQLEYVENTDILFITLSNDKQKGVSPKTAAEIISQIEPRIIVPLFNGPSNEAESLTKKIIRELGNSHQLLDKLKITRKDLPQEETQLVILKPSL